MSLGQGQSRKQRDFLGNRESVQGHLLVGFPCMGIQARVVWQGLNGLIAGSFASEWGTRRERTPLIVPQRSKEEANGGQRGGCRSGTEEKAGTVERRRGNRDGGARRAGPRRHSFLSTAKRFSSRGLYPRAGKAFGKSYVWAAPRI